MKAITQHRYGGLDTLEYETVARPVAAKDEVLIRVQGASINAADWLLMQGEPFVARLAFGLRRPKVSTRGRDVAGVIEAVGDNVRRFSVGDEVYAEVDAGSFAEYTVAQAKRLAHKPSRISFGEAAAVPIAATTALQGVGMSRRSSRATRCSSTERPAESAPSPCSWLRPAGPK
jgi:NADPH:quinone reductase-like Zn-dependent oxidoreductase